FKAATIEMIVAQGGIVGWAAPLRSVLEALPHPMPTAALMPAPMPTQGQSPQPAGNPQAEGGR
ncbi:MAG: hypothetical protein ACKOB5_15155, partial [Betaproteobacteria bacterium]